MRRLPVAIAGVDEVPWVSRIAIGLDAPIRWISVVATVRFT